MLRIHSIYLFCFLFLMGPRVYGEEPPAAPPAAAPESAPALSGSAPPDSVVHRRETPAAPAAAAPETAVKDKDREAQTRPAAAEAPALREQAAKTWSFLRDIGKDPREEMMETALYQLTEFLRLNADWDFSDEARLLKADLHARRGEYKFAVVDILILLHEYPAAKSAFQAKRTFAELTDKKMEKKIRSVLSDAVKVSEAKEKPERLAQLLKKISEQAGEALYDPLVAAFDDFFLRFPSYAGSDELNLLFGDLQVRKEKYLAAQTYYRKVLALYPESRFLPRAQRAIADVYVNNLKDVNEAVTAYQEVISRYPQSEETCYAYEQSAKLEEQLNHYDLSIELYEKIVQLYQGKDAALRAFNNEARIQRDLKENLDEAIRTYDRLADMLRGTAGAAEGLKSAAAVARKQKNYEVEVAHYLRFVKEYPTNKEAAEIYYQAGQVIEENLANTTRAIETYSLLADAYPDNKYAKKARGRIESLIKK